MGSEWDLTGTHRTCGAEWGLDVGESPRLEVGRYELGWLVDEDANVHVRQVALDVLEAHAAVGAVRQAALVGGVGGGVVEGDAQQSRQVARRGQGRIHHVSLSSCRHGGGDLWPSYDTPRCVMLDPRLPRRPRATLGPAVTRPHQQRLARRRGRVALIVPRPRHVPGLARTVRDLAPPRLVLARQKRAGVPHGA